MKYLKTYKLFESKSYVENLSSDVLTDLVDDGYVCKCKFMQDEDDEYLSVTIGEERKPFYFKDIRDVVNQLINRLDSEHFTLSGVYYHIYGYETMNWRGTSLDPIDGNIVGGDIKKLGEEHELGGKEGQVDFVQLIFKEFIG